MTIRYSSLELSRLLEEHLGSWGLKRFHEESEYYQWQNSVLSPSDLSSLNQLAQDRQSQEGQTADIRFYDLAASPSNLPVLYSQRYAFYQAVGVAIALRLPRATRVLDFGSGVGILTMFWASLFPDTQFVGIDRSFQSIAVAKQQASYRQLKNINFEHRQIPGDEIGNGYDCLVSTQALFQAENHPGLCSADWNTFERCHDMTSQKRLEEKTGIGERLDALSLALEANGKMVLCEKTQHLGRRVLLQRALARRGFQNIAEPMVLMYEDFGERMVDGPVYELSRIGGVESFHWNEQPDLAEGQSLYMCAGRTANEIYAAVRTPSDSMSDESNQGLRQSFQLFSGTWRDAITYRYLSTDSGFQGIVLGSVRDEGAMVRWFRGVEGMTEQGVTGVIQRIWGRMESIGPNQHVPCYENHTVSAQAMWLSLPDRSIQDENTFRESNGRAMHIELGTSGPLTYVYWANTYDQRQLVIATSLNADWLVAYYRNSLADMQTSSNL